jgi:TrmH family RNA methyltransferase
LKRWRRWVAHPSAAREDRIVVLEGAHLIDAWHGATVAPWRDTRGQVVEALVEQSAWRDGRLAGVADALGDAIELPDALFSRVSATTGSNAAVLFVTRPAATGPQADRSTAVASTAVGPAFELWLDGVQDPGNVGTIIRTAAAFAATRVVLGAGCADPWSPKCLRAGMGGQFHVPVVEHDDLAALIRAFDGDAVGLDASATEAVDRVDTERAVAWVLGSEGQGLGPDVRAALRRRAVIAMPGRSESLNVAAAAAIVCHMTASSRVRR